MCVLPLLTINAPLCLVVCSDEFRTEQDPPLVTRGGQTLSLSPHALIGSSAWLLTLNISAEHPVNIKATTQINLIHTGCLL